MTLPLVRVPLTLATALAFHVSMSPPTHTPSTSKLDQPNDRRVVCAAARSIVALLTKGFYWTAALTDSLVLLAPYVSFPTTEMLFAWIKNPMTSSLSCLPSFSLPILNLPLLSIATIAGTTLATAGALLRYTAYDALGQFYACPNPGRASCQPRDRTRGHTHALITSGPYTFVRHPGYAGLVLCTTGLTLFHLGALNVHSGSSGVVSTGMRTVALVCAVLGTVGAIRRIEDEERALSVRFKGEWESWSQRVRYKLLPGIY